MADLIGTIDLSNSEDYQAIYFSQVYGTFFGVYAKFQCTKDGDKHYKMDYADFKIVNYKGLLNLGITSVIGPIGNDDDKEKLFRIEVRARNGQMDSNPVNCNQRRFAKDDKIMIERTLKPMHSGGKDFDDFVFDDEFFYREGVFRDTGAVKSEPRTIGAAASTQSDTSGWECPRSENKVIWWDEN